MVNAFTAKNRLSKIEEATGFVLQTYQREAATAITEAPSDKSRFLLHYKTGAGKTLTSLTMLAVAGWKKALVIAPPITHEGWQELANKLGINVSTISHAKFRQAGFKVDRCTPIIADEFHLFGGHKGKGFAKFNRTAKGLDAPMILASATPNYNDAERAYCVLSVIHPEVTKGGYLAFLYTHCTTEMNPFGQEPIVTGFHKFDNVTDFLTSFDNVLHVEDDAEFSIEEIEYQVRPSLSVGELFFGLDLLQKRVIASAMERRHALKKRAFMSSVTSQTLSLFWVYKLRDAYTAAQRDGSPLLVYCDSSWIAEKVSEELKCLWVTDLITGKTPSKKKLEIAEAFRNRDLQVLVGTASLATGTDGFDKVCNHLFILDDTQDDSLRRQLIGRVLPRGVSTGVPKTPVITRVSITDLNG